MTARSHTFRPPRAINDGGLAVDCQTGKRAFTSKADAKVARRRTQGPGSGGLNAFRCLVCDYWHLGHLPRAVVAGVVTRADIAPSVRAA